MGASREPAWSPPAADAPGGIHGDDRIRPSRSHGDDRSLPSRSHVVAVLPGDGIGPEVVAEARKAVDAAGVRLGFGVDWVEFDLGADRYLATGEVLPDTVLKELGQVDAILLGAVGRPDVPPGVLERGLLLRLRFELDLYVNLRPVKLYPGVASPLAGAGPDDVDLLVVRENTEGAYVGAGGTVHQGTPAEVATEESLNTRHGVERCLRYAAGLARERDGVLTLVHKTNVLTHAGGLWARTAREVAGETGVRLEYAHVDAACLYLVTDPGRFDVVVTDNLFGDILTDLGAAVAGGLGTAASANLNPGGRRAHPGGGGGGAEGPHGVRGARAQPPGGIGGVPGARAWLPGGIGGVRGAQAQPPGAPGPVAVRAGARLGPGHRRDGTGQPGRRRAVRRPAARPPRRGARGRRGRGGGRGGPARFCAILDTRAWGPDRRGGGTRGTRPAQRR